MSQAWQSLVLSGGDALLGWTLRLPRDLTLVVLGLLCAATLAAIRCVTTDREQLRRIIADERRLRELRGAARRAGDREAIRQYRAVRQLVASQRTRQEWKHVAAAALFLAAVMTWGNARLSYLPVRAGERMEFAARFPAASAGQTAHVVPQSGLRSLNGWIQPVAQAAATDSLAGRATWVLQFEDGVSDAALTIRYRERSIVHPVCIGGATYLAPVHRDATGIETEVRLAPYRPLGRLPSRPLGLPAWALVLTLLTAAGYAALRRFLSLS
jgi:hypothetical protein